MRSISRSSISRLTMALALSAVAFVGVCIRETRGHDTWVQTNTNLVRVGDVTHVDLMLGNHGNEHRDFKLAGKITLAPCTLAVRSPSGETYDVKPKVADLGYEPKEGFWSARFVAGEAGLHTVVHTLDTLHRTTRAIKSSKAFFLASESLDKPSPAGADFAKPFGHPLEIVPMTDPTAIAPGKEIRIQVLYRDQPLANARVAFIPRGGELKEGFDAEFERNTDEQGRASFKPREATYHLIVVHHREPEQKGEGFDQTHYSASMTLYVPQLCACCDE